MTEDHQFLIDGTPQLSDSEAAFMRRLYERVLITGRRTYSAWVVANEKRNMRAEASDELLDGCVYLAMDLEIKEAARRSRINRFKYDTALDAIDSVIVDLAGLRPDPVATFDVSDAVHEVLPPGGQIGGAK